jgi:hypothetical protein
MRTVVYVLVSGDYGEHSERFRRDDPPNGGTSSASFCGLVLRRRNGIREADPVLVSARSGAGTRLR